ncbi:hypothetical protein DFH06DRAFT_1126582 [Mycena polygramma]|nr:hypothetical protein DFH06DRAFT_1126582 [Mycena polygramma]
MPAGLHWLPPPSMNIIQFLSFSLPTVVPLACEFSTEDAASVPDTPPTCIPQSQTLQRLEGEFLKRFRSKTPPHSIRVCYGLNTVCEPLWMLSFWKRAHEICKEHTSWTTTHRWLYEGPSSPEQPILWQHFSRLTWDGPKIRIQEWHAPPSALTRLLSDRWLSDEGMDLIFAVLQRQLPPEEMFRDLVGNRDVAGFWNVGEEHWVVFCTLRFTGSLCYGDSLQQGRHCPVVDKSLRVLLLWFLPQTLLEPTTMRTGIQELWRDGFSCGPLSAEALLGYLLHRWGRKSHTPMGSHADERRIWRMKMGVQILELAQAPNATARIASRIATAPSPAIPAPIVPTTAILPVPAPMVPATAGLPTLAGDSMTDIFNALASMTITPRFSREDENAKRQLAATQATTKQLQEDTQEEKKKTQWLGLCCCSSVRSPLVRPFGDGATPISFAVEVGLGVDHLLEPVIRADHCGGFGPRHENGVHDGTVHQRSKHPYFVLGVRIAANKVVEEEVYCFGDNPARLGNLYRRQESGKLRHQGVDDLHRQNWIASFPRCRALSATTELGSEEVFTGSTLSKWLLGGVLFRKSPSNYLR